MKFLVSLIGDSVFKTSEAKMWISLQIVVLFACIAVICAAPAPNPDYVAAVPSLYSPYYATPYSYSNYYSYPSVYSPYYGGLGKWIVVVTSDLIETDEINLYGSEEVINLLFSHLGYGYNSYPSYAYLWTYPIDVNQLWMENEDRICNKSFT